MQCSKSLGYLAYPLLTFFLVAALSTQAQTTNNPAQSAPPAQSPAPDTDAQPTPLQPTEPTPVTRDPLSQAQQQQGNSSSQPQKNYPNEQDRVRLAREAQERVRARREARTQATIKDTYSHKYEIYFGYAYLRMRPGHDLQHANESGWNAGWTRLFADDLLRRVAARLTPREPLLADVAKGLLDRGPVLLLGGRQLQRGLKCRDARISKCRDVISRQLRMVRPLGWRRLLGRRRLWGRGARVEPAIVSMVVPAIRVFHMEISMNFVAVCSQR